MSTLLCYSFVLLCFLSFFFAVNGDENGLSEMRDACSVPASKQPTAKLPLELAFSLPLSLGHIGDIRDTVLPNCDPILLPCLLVLWCQWWWWWWPTSANQKAISSGRKC